MKRSAIILMSVLAFAACGHRGGGGNNPGTNNPPVVEPGDTVAATSLPAEQGGEDIESPLLSGNNVSGVAVMPDASSVKAIQVDGKLEFEDRKSVV